MSDYKVESNGPHSISILIWEISQIGRWARKWFLLFSRFYDSAGPCITNVFCDTSQEFQPMASQLSKKAALPLAKILATCRNSVSNTGPRASTSYGWPGVLRQVETFIVSKSVTLSQEHPFVCRYKCCCPRRVNISNVSFTSKNNIRLA